MQKKKQAQMLSRRRQELRQLLDELGRTLIVVFASSPMVKGNVYELGRKCGNPSCRCARGKLHRSMVLSWSQYGKTRLMAIPPQRLEELRGKSAEYLRFRRSRARVSVIYKGILTAIDSIEKRRLEKP